MKSNKSLPKTNKTKNNFEKFPKNHVFCYKKYFSIENVRPKFRDSKNHIKTNQID